MLGVRRLLPGGEMASGIPAVRGSDLQAIVAANVAIRTGNISVSVRKWEIDRRGGMVYGRSQPAVKVVAGLASLWKLGGYVIWIGSLLEIGLVTGDAGC